ncbi:MAG: ATP-grasp domain-containing protein [Bryobacteraceae bacterium]
MPRASLNILITGAGAPGIRGTLYALRRNPDKVEIRTVGIDTKQDVVGRYLVDQFYDVPAPESSDYIPAMLKICRQEAIDLVLPQTTREIAILSQQKQAFGEHGIAVMVASGSAVAAANDKGEILDHFAALGLPHPRFYRAATEQEVVEYSRQLGYPKHPVVVKPPVSNGMRGLRVLMEDAWNVERFLKEKPAGTEIALSELLQILRRGNRWPDLLVTEYLSGSEYSVDAFIGRNTSVAIPRLRRAIRSGISFENEIEYRADVAEYTLQAGRHLGLTGAFGFQFKLDENGVAKVLECNPRVQGTMVASLFSGVNVIWLAVKEALGEAPAEIPPLRRPAQFYRFWGGLGVYDGGSHEI